MRGLQLVDSWSSRPGEPFAGLPKCFEGNGQKEVSCAGLHGPARAARAALGGVTRMGLVRVPPPREARTESVMMIVLLLFLQKQSLGKQNLNV